MPTTATSLYQYYFPCNFIVILAYDLEYIMIQIPKCKKSKKTHNYDKLIFIFIDCI